MALQVKINPPDEIERLVNDNRKLVAFFANQFEHRRLANWDDLISNGEIGLWRAARRYNPKKGKFSTYAAHWVRKYFFKAVEEQLRMWKVSLNAPRWNVSLNAPVGKSDEPKERGDVIADKTAATPAELLARGDDAERFNSLMAVAGLNDREKEIIKQRYGLNDVAKPKTQKQIARKMKLTRRRIGQIEKGAREKLAALSLEALPPDFPEFS
jgi:RNA polymerase sigma factor (sigma-70 family)